MLIRRLWRDPLAHILQIGIINFLHILLRIIARLGPTLLIGFLSLKWVDIPSFFLRQVAKVLIADISFAISVKRLEDLVNIVDLVLDSHVVEGLLKLPKTDPIIIIFVEIPVCLRNGDEPLV